MGIDLTDTDTPRGGSGGVLPCGWHTVRVASCKEVTSKSQTPGIEYTLTAGDGSIRHTWWLSPAAKFRLKAFVECCGYEHKLRNFEFRDILGAQVQIRVDKGKPNMQGKAYNEVVEYMPVGGMRQVPVNAVGNVADDETPF